MYQFAGLSTYLVGGIDSHKEGLAVLTEALDSLSDNAIPLYDELEANVQASYQSVMQSEAFRYLDECGGFTYPDSCDMPENTPEGYDRASITEVEVKGIPFTKIYVPVNAKRVDTEAFHTEKLRPVLLALFGKNVAHMVMRSANEDQDFHKAKEQILISISDKINA